MDVVVWEEAPNRHKKIANHSAILDNTTQQEILWTGKKMQLTLKDFKQNKWNLEVEPSATVC